MEIQKKNKILKVILDEMRSMYANEEHSIKDFLMLYTGVFTVILVLLLVTEVVI
jgi:hypothetical protein